MPQREDLPHIIDLWTDDGLRRLDVLARAKTYDVAAAAYLAAIAADKHAFISHGARIIFERQAKPWTPTAD